jgi:hypothetical protein
VSQADVRDDFTIDDIADAAERLGLRRASVIQAASLENPNPLSRALLLGTQTSFTFRALLDKPVAAARFSGVIAHAGRQGRQFRNREGDLEWYQQGKREWVRVTIAGDRMLEVSAQRSVALGLLQWVGPSAGVVMLATAYSLFATGGPPPSGGLILATAVFGFALARGAWTKIVEQWQADVAGFAVQLEAHLNSSSTEASHA